MNAFQNYFFDFDGTLCDTDVDIRQAWRAALMEIDLPHADIDSVFRNGPPIDEVIRELFGEAATTPELIATVRAHFRDHYDGGGFPHTHPYPGIEAWLRTLKARGARLFIVTNKRYAATNLLVDKLGWRELFTTIYASDMFMDTPIGKLKKAALLAEALRREGATAADSVMVGDTANDIEAGKANRIATLGCAWGYGSQEEIKMADEVLTAVPHQDFYRKAALVLEVPEVGPDTVYAELEGWCSLKAFGLLTMLENDFGLRLSIGEFLAHATLGELAALVKEAK